MGIYSPNQFFYKPSLGASGDDEKALFDAALDQVDNRLGRECWVTDKRFAGGAKGDGLIDDYAAFAAALAAAKNNMQPGMVKVPPGTYKISKTLLVENASVICSPYAVFKPYTYPTAMTMVEMGKTSSWEGGFFCTYDGDFTGTIMLLDGSRIKCGFSHLVSMAPKINNVDMFSKAVAGGSGTGILITADGSGNLVTVAQFTNIRMRNFTTGIKLYSANSGYVNSNQFNNILIFGAITAIIVQRATGSLGTDGNLFANVAIQPTPTPDSNIGILIDGGGHNLFSNLICWDSSVFNTYALQIINNAYMNTIVGSGYQGYTLDNGNNSMIQRVSNKSWSGATN